MDAFEPVYPEAHLGLRIFNVPVHIDDALGFIHEVANLPGQGNLTIVIGTVDLGYQGLKDRGSGGHFSHFDPRPMLPGNRLQ